jgi:hypothetical protein
MKEVFCQSVFKRMMYLFFLFPFFISAQITDTTYQSKLKLDLQIFDFPYQITAAETVGKGFFSSYANPSMSQSLYITASVYSGVHYGLKSAFKNKPRKPKVRSILQVSSIVLSDFLLFYAPLGDGWLHEEYHRAVLTRFGVNSFNQMNTFPVGSSIISVNHLKDEDLERFKSNNPADFVRMSAAGIEGQYLLIDQLQRNNFFHQQKLHHEVQYLLSTINSIIYVSISSHSKKSNEILDEMNAKETDISSRDFTGLDMISWAYDLFHPDEPYNARGIHPSGLGIDRYRKTEHLEKHELKYLKQQRYWHCLNLLSPMLFKFRAISLKNGFSGNFAFRHFLTSFGTDISLNVFLKKSKYNFVFVHHYYLNYKHLFSSIEVEMLDYPLFYKKLNVFLSPRIMVGVQPNNQEFMTSKADFLGLIGCRADFRIRKNYFSYLEVVAKTKGWVAGNVYLDDNVSIKMGFSARF